MIFFKGVNSHREEEDKSEPQDKSSTRGTVILRGRHHRMQDSIKEGLFGLVAYKVENDHWLTWGLSCNLRMLWNMVWG